MVHFLEREKEIEWNIGSIQALFEIAWGSREI